ncbi:PRELI domain-containing protein 1, mitochondrial [Centruroides vittatus]|uniref:PRELI domain-containing protein 1, mitochondrial n=1 Tax=Centruroides vittatus TaxID=120091 RepID=UPI00350EDC16
MGKFYERSDIFKYTWDQVAQAFWSRYPNPFSQHVLSEDVVFRQIKDGKLHSKRLLTKTNRIPKWGERFVSTKCVRIVEESVVDPVNKVITTYTRNIGFKSVMTIEEKCVYQMCEDNPKWTIVNRYAWVSSSVFGFARAIQAFGVERFRQNSIKTCRGFNYVLENLFPLIHNQETVPNLIVNKEKLKDKAKKATELAKSKAEVLVAACNPNSQ